MRALLAGASREDAPEQASIARWHLAMNLDRIVLDRGSRATIFLTAVAPPGGSFLLHDPIRGRYRVTLWRGRRIIHRSWITP